MLTALVTAAATFAPGSSALAGESEDESPYEPAKVARIEWPGGTLVPASIAEARARQAETGRRAAAADTASRPEASPPRESASDRGAAPVPEAAPEPARGGAAELDATIDGPRHAGFVTHVAAGAMGCTGKLCRGQDTTTAPGFAASLGYAIDGRLEVGVAAAHSASAGDAEGRSLLELYGIAPMSTMPLMEFANELSATGDVDTATSRAGLSMRLHAFRRGRVSAWAGVGIGYRHQRNHYTTVSGPARVDLHGMDLPAELGVAIHVHRNVSVGVDGSFAWTHWASVRLAALDQTLALPLGSLDRMLSAPSDIGSRLPMFWTANGAMRLTF